jgi:enamine deaminase RidA (YjgF/YER057c/UK114 family)
MNSIEDRLRAMNLELGEPRLPVGNYVGCKKVGDLLFASALVSELRGEVGTEVTEDQAKEAAQITALQVLAIIKQDIQDLDLLTGVVKMTGFIRSCSTFTNQPKVLDGASDILIALFSQAGLHARTATGVAQLPFGASVQLDIIFQIKSNN